MSTPRRDSRPEPSPGPELTPRPGEVLQVTEEASVQFRRPIQFRVIRVLDRPTYAGWMWLDGYQLNEAGEAVERRSIFVRAAGLRLVSRRKPARTRPVTGPAGRRPGPAPAQPAM